MRVSDELRTTKSKVKRILEKYPETRDSDKLLWLAYMNLHHGLKNQIGDQAYSQLKLVILHPKTPLFESVRRVRQKIQEEGKCLGEKRKNRIASEKDVRDWSRNG